MSAVASAKPYTVCMIDSGIGGLSILESFVALSPSVSIIYCADYGFFPYGEKSSEDLLQRILYLVEHLRATYEFDLLVFPCNTASTLILDLLRKKYTFPIVGTVPAIKPASETSQTKIIGVLATRATVDRAYITDLETLFAQGCTVVRCGSARLVEVAEEKFIGHGFVDRAEIEKEISTLLKTPGLDTVVLACTHFCFLREELQACFGKGVQLVDSSEAVARRIASLLPEAARHGISTGEHTFFSTEEISTKLQVALLKRYGFSHFLSASK